VYCGAEHPPSRLADRAALCVPREGGADFSLIFICFCRPSYYYLPALWFLSYGAVAWSRCALHRVLEERCCLTGKVWRPLRHGIGGPE
jgi:hypothetical protein